MNAIIKGYQDVPMTRRRAQLLAEYADKLAEMLENAPDDQDLAEWVQSKIDRAAGAIQSAYHYLDQEDDEELEKAVGHKYTHRKRVGTDKRGRARYRYYYAEHQGGGITRASFEAGSAFKLTYKGRRGHFHIHHVEGDQVFITHDSRPDMEPVSISKGELRALLKRQHTKAEQAHVEKRRKEVEKIKSRNVKQGLGLALHRLRQAAQVAGVELDERYQRKPKKKKPAQRTQASESVDATIRRMIPPSMIADSIPSTPISLDTLVNKVLKTSGAPSLSPENMKRVNDHVRAEVDKMLSERVIETYAPSRPYDALFTPAQATDTPREDRFDTMPEVEAPRDQLTETAQQIIEEANQEHEERHDEHQEITKFELGEHTHTKTGAKLFTAKQTERVDRDEYFRRVEIAKKHQGRYERRYVRGFVFKNAEDARAFALEVEGAAQEAPETSAETVTPHEDHPSADNFETMPEVESVGTPKTLLDDIRSEITVERFIREGRRREDTAEREVKKLLGDLEKLEQSLLNREYSTEAKQAKAQEILNRRLPKILEQVRRLTRAKLVRPQLSGGAGQRNAARYHRALGEIGIAEDRANEEYRRALKELDQLEEKPPLPTTPREQLTETAREARLNVKQVSAREAIKRARGAQTRIKASNRADKLTKTGRRARASINADKLLIEAIERIMDQDYREMERPLPSDINQRTPQQDNFAKLRGALNNLKSSQTLTRRSWTDDHESLQKKRIKSRSEIEDALKDLETRSLEELQTQIQVSIEDLPPKGQRTAEDAKRFFGEPQRNEAAKRVTYERDGHIITGPASGRGKGKFRYNLSLPRERFRDEPLLATAQSSNEIGTYDTLDEALTAAINQYEPSDQIIDRMVESAKEERERTARRMGVTPTRTAHTIVLDRLLEAKRSGNEAQESQANEQLRPQLMSLLERLEQGTLDQGERQALLSRYQELETLTTGAAQELAQEIVSRLQGADNFETMPEVESAPRQGAERRRKEALIRLRFRQLLSLQDQETTETLDAEENRLNELSSKLLRTVEKAEQKRIETQIQSLITEAREKVQRAEERAGEATQKLTPDPAQAIISDLMSLESDEIKQAEKYIEGYKAERYKRANKDLYIKELSNLLGSAIAYNYESLSERYSEQAIVQTLERLEDEKNKPHLDNALVSPLLDRQPTTPREQLTETVRELSDQPARTAAVSRTPRASEATLTGSGDLSDTERRDLTNRARFITSGSEETTKTGRRSRAQKAKDQELLLIYNRLHSDASARLGPLAPRFADYSQFVKLQGGDLPERAQTRADFRTGIMSSIEELRNATTAQPTSSTQKSATHLINYRAQLLQTIERIA